jgi:hypothetical protein
MTFASVRNHAGRSLRKLPRRLGAAAPAPACRRSRRSTRLPAAPTTSPTKATPRPPAAGRPGGIRAGAGRYRARRRPAPDAQTRLLADLAQVLREYKLPSQPLRDLLSAFRQDVGTTRYADLRQSARLLPPLGEPGRPADAGTCTTRPTRPTWRASDAICTALQLINFWQDVAVDWQKGRIYLPQEDLARFGVAEAQIAARTVDEAWPR